MLVSLLLQNVCIHPTINLSRFDRLFKSANLLGHNHAKVQSAFDTKLQVQWFFISDAVYMCTYVIALYIVVY